MTTNTNNNSSSSNATIDAALLVPDVLSMPTPLRAESLRQLEEVGPCDGAETQQQQEEETASRASTPSSELSPPPTTTDEEEEDAASLASSSSDDDGLDGSSTGSVVATGPGGSAFASRDGLEARVVPLAPLSADGKKVLVTGGAGFVGSHVADHLLSRGDAVILVDEFNDYYDTSLKRANVAYLLEKHGSSRLRIVEVRVG
jgi:hypothetical protein